MKMQKLSDNIIILLDQLGVSFTQFQMSTKLHCPSECSKCCYNKEISCTPYELLPAAIKAYRQGTAIALLEKAKANLNNYCVFLDQTDPIKKLGRCISYQERPLICRSFGVAARKNLKKEVIELSICRELKDIYQTNHLNIEDVNVPLVENAKRSLIAFDPVFMEKECPINQALCLVLEKVLIYFQYHELTTDLDSQSL